MRKKLFRGKRRDNSEWVEGAYYHQTEFYGDADDEHHIITSNDELEDNMMECYRVIPETVGQYTGLTDKNGTKIFEGDIVKDCYGEVELCYYHEEKHRLIFDATHFIRELEVANVVECEVIGNIHDNPELLAKK